jgi:hypothetical protein
MGDARQTVEGDVVTPSMPSEHPERAPAQLVGRSEMRLEGLHRFARRVEQHTDLVVALSPGFVIAVGQRAALADFRQPVSQGPDKGVAARRIVEQIILEVGIALHDPDVAQHLVQHARRTAGHAFAAQFIEHPPHRFAQQADNDLAIRERSVVVWDFAQAHAGWHVTFGEFRSRLHRDGRGFRLRLRKRFSLAYCGAGIPPN